MRWRLFFLAYGAKCLLSIDNRSTVTMPKRPPQSNRRARKSNSGGHRTRCYNCFRPVESCFCSKIPQIDNRVEILILQHQRERSHPFNTARIVNLALGRCQMLVERNERFSELDLPIGPDAALLYPGKDAMLLTELPSGTIPSQLVIIDGTWDQARTIYRDVPQLHRLPQFKLSPTNPGQYRIRLEPTSTSLSTLEATVMALRQLEPETVGFNKLLAAFDTMIENQLRHPQARYDLGLMPRSGSTLNLPKSFQRDPQHIVVAYAEATPVQYVKKLGWTELNEKKRSVAQEPPVYWLAQRLDSRSEHPSDTFAATIEPKETISPANLAHMELNASHFESALSVEEFKSQWADFVQPEDLLVVPNIKTIRMLRRCGAAICDFETIRSINYDPSRKFDSIESFLRSISFTIEPPRHPGRAGKRLANAVALTKFLNFKALNPRTDPVD